MPIEVVRDGTAMLVTSANYPNHNVIFSMKLLGAKEKIKKFLGKKAS